MSVRIEPVDETHEARVQELAADPAIAATSNVPSPYPPDGARTWIARVQEKRRNGSLFAFAIIDPEEGLVGISSLMGVDRSQRKGSLGYWTGRRYWGRGYATAGSRLVVSFGFSELQLASIRATCLAANPASARVLRKLGFEAGGPGPVDPRGATVDFILKGTNQTSGLDQATSG